MKVRLIEAEIQDKPDRAVIKINCFMHNFQNGAKKANMDLDKFGPGVAYSTQVQRICNAWRGFGHHRKLEKAIEARYDKATAKCLMATCISKVVKARWLTFEAPERKLLRGFFGTMERTAEEETSISPLQRALSASARPMPSTAAIPIADTSAPVDGAELDLEESDAAGAGHGLGKFAVD